MHLEEKYDIGVAAARETERANLNSTILDLKQRWVRGWVNADVLQRISISSFISISQSISILSLLHYDMSCMVHAINLFAPPPPLSLSPSLMNVL